jgi:hypothetical protein
LTSLMPNFALAGDADLGGAEQLGAAGDGGALGGEDDRHGGAPRAQQRLPRKVGSAARRACTSISSAAASP